MEPLVIEGTGKHPEINLNAETGVLKIWGRSIPEDSKAFYSGIKEWIKQYSEHPAETTTVNIGMEYFNTSTSKALLEVLRLIEDLESSGANIVVNWHYEEDDDDMMEAGEDYQNVLDIKLNLIAVPEE